MLASRRSVEWREQIARLDAERVGEAEHHGQRRVAAAVLGVRQVRDADTRGGRDIGLPQASAFAQFADLAPEPHSRRVTFVRQFPWHGAHLTAARRRLRAAFRLAPLEDA